MKIVIRGDGIAARGCSKLLGSAGFAIAQEGTNRTPVPALMVGERTQRLLCGVFEKEDLFDGLPRIEMRIVRWAKDSGPLRLPHSAVVVPEAELLARLKSSVDSLERTSDCEPDWTIFASRPLPAPGAEHHFGSRVATVLGVDLKDNSETSACWIESLPNGWLFLLPDSPRKGWLLSVGAAQETLLKDSRLVAGQIQCLGASAGQFPAYPAIADPICGSGWLACGSAALAFDPLCGDGAGNALREAILASAVIRAASRGEPEVELLDHYRARLRQGFGRHVKLCRDFYAAARQGPWWDAEIEFIQRGLEYCEQERESATPFRYRLQGYELYAV